MKLSYKLLSLLMSVIIVISCAVTAVGVSAASQDLTSSANDYNLASDVQSGQILHAWNCSYNNIKNSLSDIAQAGFSTIQLSPVQPPKDYNSSWTDVSGQWWKLYQPLGFCIASQSWLGTKSELVSLCSEAHNYGIKIIVDIVSNHMANNGSNTYTPNSGISNYEPEIYNNQSTYFHTYEEVDYSSRRLILQGNIGMPDLNTSNEYVQQRVISLLKECVDCGVDGFRFDAAKHIETPSDGSYASDFWSNVTQTTSDYAQSTQSKDIYYYGEILSPAGPSRSFSYYTPYMSITDNRTGDKVTSAMEDGGKAATVAASSYESGVSASKIVLWAESHDTYMGSSGSADYKSTKDMSQQTINKSYCFSVARKNATTLYFIRPATDNPKMGKIGTTSFKNTEIAATNKFHNNFVGTSEYLSSSGSLAMCERGSSSKGYGIVIVNCAKNGTSATVSSVTTHLMQDGKYVDEVTGNTFTVSSGKISGNIGSTGVAVIYKSAADPTESGTLYKYGDTNLNGEVTIMDVTLIQRHLASLITLTSIQKKAADVNASGDISIMDATVIQRKLAALIVTFPSGESFRM